VPGGYTGTILKVDGASYFDAVGTNTDTRHKFAFKTTLTQQCYIVDVAHKSSTNCFTSTTTSSCKQYETFSQPVPSGFQNAGHVQAISHDGR
jgi:hypothetical protein